MESQCHKITQSSNICNNFGGNNEIDCMKDEINKTRDVKHVIKSECRVVLRRLNIKVKTEGCDEVIHLPNEYEYLKLIKKNKFFTPEKRFKRNEMNIQKLL
ncbi:uncharacterized protein LOC111637863 isoform X2 [Centruroides sculpturatus]|uniref:uncharacterized protein LOC111637863 isoform X2 n=1 Tax=Centruroides sculpturatus TaxID=218467 RepID=UPI000C6D26C6|nr:uncharacterized protein LOC111637863 isoform X2 [Centruroides sculpturatus]